MPALAEAGLSWHRLVQLEPRLAGLEEDALDLHAGPGFCAAAVWTRSLKPRLTRLVGWDRHGHDEEPDSGDAVLLYDLLNSGLPEVNRRGALWSSGAYDVAYDHLYALLPDCHDCGLCSPRGHLHAR